MGRSYSTCIVAAYDLPGLDDEFDLNGNYG